MVTDEWQNNPEKIDPELKMAGQPRPSAFRAGRFSFPLNQRTYIMGILNVTPDSFSDGGQYLKLDQALQHAGEMLEQGADIIDIGGESTRPGHAPVSVEEEEQRIIPVIDKIYRKFNCPISVDTSKPEVAEAALAAGACIVNDVLGLQQDPAMAATAFRHQAGVVIMHNARLYRRENPAEPEITQILTDMKTFLRQSCQIASQAGLRPEQLLIDPGIGFGVSAEESIWMIAHLDQLADLNLPILLGPSRKRFISYILGLPGAGRLHGTSAAVAIGIARGADFVRVHDVREMSEVVRVADALCRQPLGGRES